MHFSSRKIYELGVKFMIIILPSFHRATPSIQLILKISVLISEREDAHTIGT